MWEWEKKAVRIWNSDPMAIGLGSIGTVGALWVSIWVPSPGVSIGLLAAAAAIMSIRLEMRPTEKIAWIVILVALTTTEIRSIFNKDAEDLRDRAALNKRFAEIEEEQQKQFTETVRGLGAIIAQNQQDFDATMKRSDIAISATETNLEAVTGSTSFPEFMVSPEPNADGTYRLEFSVVGKYPMRNVSVGMQTIESNSEQIHPPKDVNCTQCEIDYMARLRQTARSIPISDAESTPNVIQTLSENLALGKYLFDTWSAGGWFRETLTLELDEKGRLNQKRYIFKPGNPTMIVVDEKLVAAYDVNGKLVPLDARPAHK